LPSLLLSFIGLGLALWGWKLVRKPNPTDVGPLRKVEELITEVSVAYCFVALIDTGVFYVKMKVMQ